MGVEGRGLFFLGSRESLVSESVWRSLFEGDELGGFCKGFDVQCTGSAYDYGYYFDTCF